MEQKLVQLLWFVVFQAFSNNKALLIENYVYFVDDNTLYKRYKYLAPSECKYAGSRFDESLKHTYKDLVEYFLEEVDNFEDIQIVDKPQKKIRTVEEWY